MSLGAAMHRTSAEANGPALPPGSEVLHRVHDAEQGSAALLDALHAQFLDLAMKHRGITLKDASLFCMNGVGL